VCSFFSKISSQKKVVSTGARVLEHGGSWAVLGAHGERVEREPLTGVMGAEPLVMGIGGQSPLKLKAF